MDIEPRLVIERRLGLLPEQSYLQFGLVRVAVPFRDSAGIVKSNPPNSCSTLRRQTILLPLR